MKSLPTASHEARFNIGKWNLSGFIVGTKTPLRLIGRSDVSALIPQPASRKLESTLTKLKKHPALKGQAFIKSGFDLKSPIAFLKRDGSQAEGIVAEDFIELCRFILKAREYGLLEDSSLGQTAESIIVSISKVGVVALIDEATGYQGKRESDALRKLLDKYLRQEHAVWAKRFPDEFYKEIFRLKGWKWEGMNVNRPGVVGLYTRDIVYARLAPGILTELEKLNPVFENGHRKVKHHQFMTTDIGHPALNGHLQGVLALLRASQTWGQFNSLLKKSFPRIGDQLDLLDLAGSDLD